MSRRELIWTKAAEADLQTIFEYQEEFESGQGERFLALVDDALELLRVFPEMAPVYAPPFRRLLFASCNHGIFYVIEDRGIIIHAVADLRRDPSELRARFKRAKG